MITDHHQQTALTPPSSVGRQPGVVMENMVNEAEKRNSREQVRPFGTLTILIPLMDNTQACWLLLLICMGSSPGANRAVLQSATTRTCGGASEPFWDQSELWTSQLPISGWIGVDFRSSQELSEHVGGSRVGDPIVTLADTLLEREGCGTCRTEGGLAASRDTMLGRATPEGAAVAHSHRPCSRIDEILMRPVGICGTDSLADQSSDQTRPTIISHVVVSTLLSPTHCPLAPAVVAAFLTCMATVVQRVRGRTGMQGGRWACGG